MLVDSTSKEHQSPSSSSYVVLVCCRKVIAALRRQSPIRLCRHDITIGGIALFIGMIMGALMTMTTTTTGESILFNNGIADELFMAHHHQYHHHPFPPKSPGWNPIHVFYGNMNPIYDEIPERWYLKHSIKHQTEGISREWFGQHGQDLAVAMFFNMKTNGYFVDLASNDAVWASNTFALEQNLDWKGICIEPNPIYWYRLAFRTNCHVVGSIVGKKDLEEITVSLPKDPKMSGPFGGIVGDEFDNKRATKENAQRRFTASLIHILEKFHAPKVIDYLSLDVEGAEEFILKDFPFNKPYTFRVLSIERPKELLRKKLQEAEYQLVYQFKRGDTLWAHSSVYDTGKKLLLENNNNMDEAMKTHTLPDWPKKKEGRAT